MDPERERIQSDLRGLLEGDVYCDDVYRQMYSCDASIYQIRPLGVVRPRHADDVAACLRYASEHDIPIHARGAGTGVAGESLGLGLVIDFAHYMRRILSIDQDTVRLQPGVILAQLNRQLDRTGRMFGPDPATRSVTTMGSAMALDASGSHWLKYGSVRDNVVSLQVVTADGQTCELNRHAFDGIRSRKSDPDLASMLAMRTADLVQRNAALIDQGRPKSELNRAGYHLWDLVDNGVIDLAKLIVGSEGTLGLITEATLKVVAAPKHRGVVLLFFDRLDSAARAALEIGGMGIAACDLLDRRLLSLARESDPRFEMLIPRQAEAMLLVEQTGDELNAVRDRMQQIVTRIQRRRRLAFDVRTTTELDQRNLFWRLTRRVIPTLYRLKGSQRAIPFVEDVAIPRQLLPDILVKLQNLLKKFELTASVFAHAAHGQLHVRPFVDLTNAQDVRKLQPFANEFYQIVVEAGGTISGEHGVGLSRTWYLRKQYGPLYDVFREVKRIFDPSSVLNPGKVVAEAAAPPTKWLRPLTIGTGEQAPQDDLVAEASAKLEVFQPQLDWSNQEIAQLTRSCNGCGRCRTTGPLERMCPMFRVLPTEEATPRSKANLVRGMLTGTLDPNTISTDQLHDIADLCVNCHQCRLECPASVDIPKLMTEVKAQYVLNKGLKPSEMFLARLDRIAPVASALHLFINRALTNRTARWLLEKLVGIAQGRKLPRFASRSFIRMAARQRLSRPTRRSGPKVLYFVDSYANWHDVQLAQAFVTVLEHNGVSVFVPSAQSYSGMNLISMGALERAKKIATRNIELLADAVRQGYHIVSTEPSAVLCLTKEYLNLMDDEDAQLIADNTSEACSYLWRLHQSGKLELDFQPISVSLGYHLPCHQKALTSAAPGYRLLKLIPGLTVTRIEKGCSGMAGVWGLRRENYRRSLRMGRDMIAALRDSEITAGTTECSSCKMQMEQGTSKPTIHPIKILAHAYGLMPEVGELLSSRGEELVVT